ncbi:MAG: hypothetical protein KJ718_04735 [Nanoarchaeota archaeon]|nr:hypothetical protein [Nanoarchaeota archaeon]MBU1051833.1 hypothetical protein [Nanoarchaeota archaeon]MBU1988436.1 hypothetical protein [Nanoarchaeota archaeon]
MVKKSQSAIEFIILVGLMLFLFSSFLFVFQQNLEKKIEQKRNLEIKDLALTIQNEINIAAETSSGYQRSFSIPEKIIKLDYGISVADGFLYLNTSDSKHAIGLPIPTVIGEIQKGTNTITKINSTVYLNTP